MPFTDQRNFSKIELEEMRCNVKADILRARALMLNAFLDARVQIGLVHNNIDSNGIVCIDAMNDYFSEEAWLAHEELIETDRPLFTKEHDDTIAEFALDRSHNGLMRFRVLDFDIDQDTNEPDFAYASRCIELLKSVELLNSNTGNSFDLQFHKLRGDAAVGRMPQTELTTEGKRVFDIIDEMVKDNTKTRIDEPAVDDPAARAPSPALPTRGYPRSAMADAMSDPTLTQSLANEVDASITASTDGKGDPDFDHLTGHMADQEADAIVLEQPGVPDADLAHLTVAMDDLAKNGTRVG